MSPSPAPRANFLGYLTSLSQDSITSHLFDIKILVKTVTSDSLVSYALSFRKIIYYRGCLARPMASGSRPEIFHKIREFESRPRRFGIWFEFQSPGWESNPQPADFGTSATHGGCSVYRSAALPLSHRGSKIREYKVISP